MILALAIIGSAGYFDLSMTKADNDTVQSLIETNLKQQAEVKETLGYLKGEMSGLAQLLTGEKSFNGNKVERYPPQQYIIDCDSCADNIPAGGYDSCMVGKRRDLTMTRPPWFCYGRDSTGIITIREFR
jgi:hypothetical protein